MASLSMNFVAVESSELERLKKAIDLASDLVCNIKNDVAVSSKIDNNFEYDGWEEYINLKNALLELGYEIK